MKRPQSTAWRLLTSLNNLMVETREFAAMIAAAEALDCEDLEDYDDPDMEPVEDIFWFDEEIDCVVSRALLAGLDSASIARELHAIAGELEANAIDDNQS